MKSRLFLILFLISFLSFAQNENAKKKQFSSISINYGFGNVIPTTDFVKGENRTGAAIQNYQYYTVNALWQNPAYKQWQQIFAVPYYGLGVAVGDFNNATEIGYPISVYGVYGLPIMRLSKFALYSEFQFGLASNWEHYDEESNPYNLVIGGGLTVHLNIGLNLKYQITPKLDLGAGINFVHFSNGGMERPNKGFNIYTPALELKYHFGGKADLKSLTKAAKNPQYHGLYMMLGYGNHQLNEHELDTNYFAIGGLNMLYVNQLSNAFRLGAGFDLNYWWGLNALPNGTIGNRTAENITLGLLIQPEILIDKLTIVGGFGIYARHLHFGNFKQSYQRLGVRYDIYKTYSIGINIRAVNFMLAEFLEFNIGYTIEWEKH